jgi:nucleoside-diphosphate-sugar epimerase
MAEKTILIAGATGVVGSAALQHFTSLAGWEVVALSRRKPAAGTQRPFCHLALDLQDAAGCRAAAASLAGVTHVVYAALYEKPGLVAGWRERDQMATNLAMLRNLMEPLADAAPGLRHVTLLQGTKAYGVHLHPINVPARERQARDAHENFYWLQQDYLGELAARRGFAWTIFRPQLVFGDVTGVAMNLTPIIAIYAALCREEGRPFAFPGGPPYLLEAIDARLLARAFAWAAGAPAAAGEIFNITNGDVFVWQNLWPGFAGTLGVETGPAAPLELKTWLPARGAVWDRIVAKHNLAPTRLSDLLGESHFYADFCFAHGATRPPPPVLVSTIKLRQAGFDDCIDTEDMFRDWFRVLMEQRLVPPAG